MDTASSLSFQGNRDSNFDWVNFQRPPVNSSMQSAHHQSNSFAAKLVESVYNVEDESDLLLSSPPAVPNIRVFSFPFLGRMQVVHDYCGYAAWSTILMYWVYGNWSTWLTILLPHYHDGQMPITMLILYTIVSTLCLTSFIRASTTSPGTVTTTMQPQEDWTICGKCCRKRPPMAHHCRRCGQCVRKMDHHCPWINNCVGEDNQFAFLQLLAYAYTLSLVTLVLDIMHMWFIPRCFTCDQNSFVMRHESGIMWTAIVMAVMMIMGSAGLYLTQHISILFDTPSMEWMRLQHTYFTQGPAAIKWPVQTKTVPEAYRYTCGDSLWLLWFLPCGRRRPWVRRAQFHV